MLRLPGSREGFDMSWRSAVGLAGFALASLAAMAPAAAEFRVCNKSGETVEVAFGYSGGGKTGWIAEGWYRVNAGGCVTVLSERLSNRYYYLYAEGTGGHAWDGTGEAGAPFCVARKRFKLFQSRYGSNEEADCAKHQLESKRFFQVDTGEHGRWVQTLTASQQEPAPAPAPPPPSASAPPPSSPPPKGSACERFPNLC
jgi:uncharacterized membrane protein